jgi:Divergent InlB B-repeat domain
MARLGLLAALALALVSLVLPATAAAAPWCGSTASENRDPGVTGRTIRVVYAIGSDGEDRSAQMAGRISAEIDEITSWWRTQDAEHEPRFDVFPFTCGLQVDLTVQRIKATAAALQPIAGRADAIDRDVFTAGGRSAYEKYLVYYDGPTDEPDVCGQGGGDPSGPAIAIVYVQSCSGVPTQVVAAHEVIHSLGALPPGAPHPCPDTSGHPCDSEADILYPFVGADPLSALVLDVGRDDYYGHSGSWLDIQDSGWLRLVNHQARLSLTIQGGGEVESDVPGVLCTASCATDWDAGAPIELTPTPAEGQRFVRWDGGCTGAGTCQVVIDVAKAIKAVFAAATYKLSLAVTGAGRIRVGATSCTSRCVSERTSFIAVSLRATAAPGWRFSRWAGACRGTSPTCRLPMRKTSGARAIFVRRT